LIILGEAVQNLHGTPTFRNANVLKYSFLLLIRTFLLAQYALIDHFPGGLPSKTILKKDH